MIHTFLILTPVSYPWLSFTVVGMEIFIKTRSRCHKDHHKGKKEAFLVVIREAPIFPNYCIENGEMYLWDETTYPCLNFNGCTVEVQELISNFIPHFMIDVITYPCWDLIQTMLIKGATWWKKVEMTVIQMSKFVPRGSLDCTGQWWWSHVTQPHQEQHSSTSAETSTVYWCSASICVLIYHFSISLTLVVLQRQKSL